MSKKTKAPAFQLYVERFLLGTMHMSNAETGAYIRMLCHQWDKKGLPNDVSSLTKLCFGDPAGIEGAMKKFDVKNGKLINKRLEIIRKTSQNFSKKQSENAKKGVKKRTMKPNTVKDSGELAEVWPESGTSSIATAISPSINNKLSRDEVYEFMYQAVDKAFVSNLRIEKEVVDFIDKYDGQKIGNLRSLVNTWADRIKPDPKKKMVV